MADATDVLLKHWEEQRIQARQAEAQRATVTNMVLVIAAAGFGFVGNLGLSVATLMVTIPLVFVGLYGALTSAKFYERFQLHHTQARALGQQLALLLPNLDLDTAYNSARTRHSNRHPRLSRIRLHHLWLSLHLSISIGALVLTAVSPFRS